jgi:tRNA-splicing ligase RtcB
MKKPEKKDLIKISDYIWEIPKSFREDMNVPARIFATEDMLDDILEDKSLWQLVNVASLPGIYKYALGMPDIHEGYGMPVGGVAAFDYEEGIISPGGIGFDINCVHPDTKVNLGFGTYLKIKDLIKHKNIKVISYDKNNFKKNETDIVLFLNKKAKNIIEIKTKFGYKLLLTEDHPFFTLNFKKKLAKNLKKGDKIYIFPFKGVEYEEPKKILIIDEIGYKKFLKKIKFKRSTIEKYTEYLKKSGFLPLYLNSKVMPYIVKILGYSIGRGSGYFKFNKKNNKNVLDFRFYFYDDVENLKEVGEDLKKINIDFSIKNKFGVWTLSIKNRPFAFLLFVLGAPFLDKTEFDFKVPKWLFKAPKFYQRLFLASLFGSQGKIYIKKNKTYVEPFCFSLNVKIKKINKTLKFFKDLKNILEKNFKIKTSKINISKAAGLEGKTVGINIRISSDIDNVLRFLENINFEYNRKKQNFGLAFSSYLNYKLKVIDFRTKIFNKMKEYKRKYGYTKKMLKEKFLNEKLYIDNHLISRVFSNKKQKIGIPRYFIKFEKFNKMYFLKKERLILDEIEEIKIKKYHGYVFDITLKDKSHNFFANNILVSNCGVRLLVADVYYEDIKDKIPKLTKEIFKEVPSGVGKGGFWKLNNDEMRRILEDGAKYMYELGFAEKEDLEATESFGKLDGDPDCISKVAKERGRDQIGTIGAGNHFVEIQRIQEIYEPQMNADTTQMNADNNIRVNQRYNPRLSAFKNNIRVNPRYDPHLSAAKKLGLEKGKITIMIHCGSRGLGHQVCTDYVKEFLKDLNKKGIDLIDRELAYNDFHSELGQRYFKAMNSAANFAWANRQMIAYQIRKAFEKVLGKGIKLKQIYDVSHNMAKIEEYDGKKLIVHRKGATRAFWKGHPELAPKYKDIGQPTLIPGSMGTASYVLIGQELSKEISFGTAPHGAGRLMSRAEAKRKIRGNELKKELEKRGIVIEAGSLSGIAEEAPEAYKDVNMVVEVVHQIGIAKKLVKLVPIGVIKG